MATRQPTYLTTSKYRWPRLISHVREWIKSSSVWHPRTLKQQRPPRFRSLRNSRGGFPPTLTQRIALEQLPTVPPAYVSCFATAVTSPPSPPSAPRVRLPGPATKEAESHVALRRRDQAPNATGLSPAANGTKAWTFAGRVSRPPEPLRCACRKSAGSRPRELPA